MIVTAAAVEGQAHPNSADGFGHVEDIVDAVFLGDGSAFPVDGVVAEEAGGDFLFEGCLGEQVAGDLPDGEVIVGKIAVEGLDDPVTPRPHGSFGVALKTIGIGVAGGIKPRPGKAFSKCLVVEKSVNEAFPGVGGIIVKKLRNFFERWR